MDVWVSASAGALNTDSAYLSARWRTTALQVRKEGVLMCFSHWKQAYFPACDPVFSMWHFTPVYHAEFRLCAQSRLGWLWAISWWRWTGSAWRASRWAALWRSWQETTGWGWWWGGWARSPASATPRRRPHGESEQMCCWVHAAKNEILHLHYIFITTASPNYNSLFWFNLWTTTLLLPTDLCMTLVLWSLVTRLSLTLVICLLGYTVSWFHVAALDGLPLWPLWLFDSPILTGLSPAARQKAVHVNVSLGVCLCVQGGSDSPADGGGGERSHTVRGQLGQRPPPHRSSLHHVGRLLSGLQHQRRQRVRTGDLCL